MRNKSLEVPLKGSWEVNIYTQHHSAKRAHSASNISMGLGFRGLGLGVWV